MKKITILQGDITEQEVDAIVNAANTSLLGGGGVDGAIHRSAGPQLLNECISLNGCPTGEAKITGGYNLKAKFIIHTVGPVWSGGDRGEDALLESCYKNSYRLATENEVTSIAFPAISTGVYRFPLERATVIALKTTKDVLTDNMKIEKVLFLCFDSIAFEMYHSIYNKIFTG